MTETCDFEEDGFCLYKDYTGDLLQCKHKDIDGFCKAKPEDLTDFCEDCFQPIEKCRCDFP